MKGFQRMLSGEEKSVRWRGGYRNVKETGGKLFSVPSHTYEAFPCLSHQLAKGLNSSLELYAH